MDCKVPEGSWLLKVTAARSKDLKTAGVTIKCRRLGRGHDASIGQRACEVHVTTKLTKKAEAVVMSTVSSCTAGLSGAAAQYIGPFFNKHFYAIAVAVQCCHRN